MTPSEFVLLMRREYVPSPLTRLKTSTSTQVPVLTAPSEAMLVLLAAGAFDQVTEPSAQLLSGTCRNCPPEGEGSATKSRSLAAVTVPPVPVTTNFRNDISTGLLSAFRPVAVP